MAAKSGAPNIVAFPGQRGAGQVCFERRELTRILDLYGRMVAAGEWRDYAMDFARDCATFAAFRRTADVPQMRLEKRPALHQKQGMWALFGEQGQVLKRGHELTNVLAPLERRLVKLVEV
ncbi:DUF2794 domain-containing protein [Aurantiacibacter poecillastricola]|uniref:DUF2794 domain-containing protein n=1 Tax=Aurantiacibacter poecillastricola TaxID=3064385 RepID=UPI00273F03CF|nr:DUF2794 domain-containing protein [Aurantiacibacter sp. 219JJ12-13]MDP5262477.1 DUF2794 domain-containing protein [Aurantiacibacter sp. 219JJ12-13]